MDFHEFLGFIGCRIKRLPMAKGNDLILPAMEDKNGAMDHRKILECTVLIGDKFHEDSGEAVPGGFPQRSKSGLEDEHPWFMNLAHPGRNGTPRDLPKTTISRGSFFSDLDKVIPDGLGIPVGPWL